MDNLRITRTKCTLGINFDADTGIFEISGESYPENAFDFFKPLFKWVEDYLQNPGEAIVLNIHITYLNSSSTRCTLDFLSLLEEYYKKERNIRVNWYHEIDDDILETAEYMASNVEIPIHTIPIEST